MIRLDKALASMGEGTRTQVKQMVKAGLVQVNGVIIRSPDTKIAEDSEIVLDGRPVAYQKYVYWMLNKPAGYITATEGREPVVMDLIDQQVHGVYPVGRLDKDTAGLLLLTNDGPLGHQLLSPKHHVEKEYYVKVKNPVSEQDIEKMKAGIKEGEDLFLPAVYHPLDETSGHIILQEGKFHEVKRIFLALDNEVLYLQRVRMKNLVLDPDLKEGEYRPLTKEEIRGLQDQD